MKMRMDFPFNMQFTFMHRRMRKKIPGGKIYRSPYPDYFATNALFWAAERIVIYPSPATLIGISPKSYGNSHFKGKEEDGALLHGSEGLLAEIPEVAKSLLPGSRSASCFFSAMACLAKVFPELGSPDRASYRRRQIEYMTRRRYVTREISSEYYREFLAKLSRAERWCIERPLALGGIVLRWMGLARSRAVLSWIKRMTGNRHKGMLVIDDVVEPPPGVVNILDAQRWLAGKSGDLTGSGLA
jgi:hypothetical protein